MEIINNIVWYFDEPKNAINKTTGKKITKKELNTVVFDDSIKGAIKICFPLNNDFLFTEIREIQRPITVEQLLTFIHNFYDEPLNQDNLDEAFERNEEWKEEILERMDGDTRKLTNYHVFEDTCTPDFCGIHLSEDSENEFFVGIGPE